MGQTLTHGIYLPDEGERNCYSGLAANWQLLDGAVGTVAEHTTALAGKAPAVHTHTKSDITDFPAYGNAAGTICEGNDSRLSDARTPVAHTHTKSDVTDLFNSANTWSASNTYNAGNAIIIQNNNVSRGSEPSSYQEQQLKWSDTDGNQIARIRYSNQLTSAGNIANGLEFSTTDKFKDGVRDPTGSTISAVFRIGLWNDGTKYVYNECRWRSNLLPFGNNTNDLGSSSYQWNNLYAKNYYYNGVAWGLDKANEWSETQIIKQQAIDIVNNPSAIINGKSLYFYDGTRFWSELRPVWNTDGSFTMELGLSNYTTDGNQGYWNINAKISKDFSTLDFYTSHGNTNLGTSTNKWKTLNGVNPGALSLPKSDTSVTAISTSGFSFDGSNERVPDTTNLFSNGEALVDGWLCARLAEGAGHYIFLNSDDNTGRYGICSSCFSSGIVTTLSFGVNVYVPIKAGDKPAIRWAKPNGGNAQLVFYPCLGNV